MAERKGNTDNRPIRCPGACRGPEHFGPCPPAIGWAAAAILIASRNSDWRLYK